MKSTIKYIAGLLVFYGVADYLIGILPASEVQIIGDVMLLGLCLWQLISILWKEK